VAGLLIYDNGRAVVMHSTARDHLVSNILMQDDTELTLTSNIVSGSRVGLSLHGTSRATVRHTTFSVRS
jgi:parallel beta-helix repeat protein